MRTRLATLLLSFAFVGTLYAADQLEKIVVLGDTGNVLNTAPVSTNLAVEAYFVENYMIKLQGYTAGKVFSHIAYTNSVGHTNRYSFINKWWFGSAVDKSTLSNGVAEISAMYGGTTHIIGFSSDSPESVINGEGFYRVPVTSGP